MSQLMDVLDRIPQDWHWQLHQPPSGYKGTVKKIGKKSKPVRYTVHISNGEMFGTKHFSSAIIDSDDLIQAIEDALALVYKRIEEKKKAEEEAKRKTKK